MPENEVPDGQSQGVEQNGAVEIKHANLGIYPDQAGTPTPPVRQYKHSVVEVPGLNSSSPAEAADNPTPAIPQYKMFEVKTDGGQGNPEPIPEKSDSPNGGEVVKAEEQAEPETEQEKSIAEKCEEAIKGKFARYHADPELERKIKSMPRDPSMEGITLRHDKPFRDPISHTINPYGYIEEIWRDKSDDSRWTYYENTFSNPTDNGYGGSTKLRTNEVILERQTDGTIHYQRVRDGEVTKKIDYASADTDDKAVVDSLMETVVAKAI